jgi:hypothetical protein
MKHDKSASHFHIMSELHGSLLFKGKEYALTQEAYVTGRADFQSPLIAYEADATDENGAIFHVLWFQKRSFVPEEMDESDACDWSNPAFIFDNYGKQI